MNPNMSDLKKKKKNYLKKNPWKLLCCKIWFLRNDQEGRMWDASRRCVCGFFFFFFFYTPVNQSLQRVWNENLAPCSKIRSGIAVLKKKKKDKKAASEKLWPAACWIHPAEKEPCDTVYDPEDYGGPDAIILIAGAGLPLAGSPEPPRSGPHDAPGSQSDEFFFSHSTCSKLLGGNGRLPGYYCFVLFFFPFHS